MNYFIAAVPKGQIWPRLLSEVPADEIDYLVIRNAAHTRTVVDRVPSRALAERILAALEVEFASGLRQGAATQRAIGYRDVKP